jgi:acyl-CoA-dependent ceramide synthase
MLKLEKPRKDYMELVAHHIVTLWLIGWASLPCFRVLTDLLIRWSYFMDLTLIGNAVFMSMDIPDTFLAVSCFFS